MKNLVAQSQGWFIPAPESRTFIGQASFIYREGLRLFTITPDGKIINRGHGLPFNQVVPVFLHKECSEKLNTHTWYSVNGKISLSRNIKSAFFLPTQVIGEMAPQEMYVEGEFTMPEGKNAPIFKVHSGKIIPLKEYGLTVFPDFRSDIWQLTPGKVYSTRGTVYVPEGNKAGVFLQTSLVQI